LIKKAAIGLGVVGWDGKSESGVTVRIGLDERRWSKITHSAEESYGEETVLTLRFWDDKKPTDLETTVKSDLGPPAK